MATPELFILAGEPSGDMLGGLFLRSLLEGRQKDSIKISGVGGPKMRAMGIELLFPTEELSVMGFIDVIKELPRIRKLLHKTADYILDTAPEATLLIDYPGFHLSLAKLLRKKGYKGALSQWVSPSVWAWKKQRASIIERHFTHLFPLFPFEEAHYKKDPLEVICSGHPLTTICPPLIRDPHYITLFPGSRKKEIERNLPLQMQAASYGPFPVAVSCSDRRYESLIRSLAPNTTIFFEEEKRQILLQTACAIAKSGTITLELALHGIPTAVTYQISYIDQLIVKHLLRLSLPNFCIVNICLNKRLLPEWFGYSLNPKDIFLSLEPLLKEEGNFVHECSTLHSILSTEKGLPKMVKALGF